MSVFRITKKTYAKDLEGRGGLFASGRWHRKGNRVIYASESISLAAWERFVHITDYRNIPSDLVVVTISIPDDIEIKEVPGHILVSGWNVSDPYNFYKKETMEFGTRFLKENRHLVLKVPSAVVENECNYLLNPSHPDIKRCTIEKIEPFAFNGRIGGSSPGS
ncbi:MAG: RES family NAD+ phosphorylase [Bacteroidota bacterium]